MIYITYQPIFTLCKSVRVEQLLIMIIIIPLPLFFAQTIYGVRGLAAWVVIGIIWVFGAIATVVITPIYESRESLSQIGRGIVKVRPDSFNKPYRELMRLLVQDMFSPGSGKFIHHPRVQTSEDKA